MPRIQTRVETAKGMTLTPEQYYYRIEEPYCVAFNKTHFYYLNREYKNIGVDTADFIKYPKLEGTIERIYFYNDSGKPCACKKNLHQYNLRCDEFLNRVARDNLKEIFKTDF